jgi:alcohol dehydrogenase (cytochrome c)
MQRRRRTPTLVERIPAGDWPAYGRNRGGDRFSPLTQIDRANVARPEQVCTYVLPDVAALQTGPIVVDGTMYFTTDTISYAIDGATCQEKWRVARHAQRAACIADSPGSTGRLFRGTVDGHVVALFPAEGRTIWDQTLDVSGPGITYPMAPIAADGLVFIGNAGGDNAGVTGHVFALDAATATSSGVSTSCRQADLRATHGKTRAFHFPAARSGRRSRTTWPARAV